VHLRVVELKLRVVPIREKGIGTLGDDVRNLLLRHLQVPLQPIRQGRARQVGRAYIGRMKTCISPKQVSLGVQALMPGVVRNFDRHIAEATQPVDGLEVGYPHIDRTDNAHRPTQRRQLLKYPFKQADALKFEEGYQPPALIGRQQLFSQLTLHRHPHLAAGKQLRFAQTRVRENLRQAIPQIRVRKMRPLKNRPQQPPLFLHRFIGRQRRPGMAAEQLYQLIGQRHQPLPHFFIPTRRHLLEGLLQPLPQKAAQKNGAFLPVEWLYVGQQVRLRRQGGRKAARDDLLVKSFLHGFSVGWVAAEFLSRQ